MGAADLLTLETADGRSQWVWVDSRASSLVAAAKELSARGLGVQRIVANLKAEHPEWEVTTKAVRAALHVAAPTAAGKADAACADPPAGACPFEIRDAEGKGKGAFATRTVREGERIIAEAPLARWSVAHEATSEARLQSFSAMAAALEPSRVAGLEALSQAALHGGERTLMGTWLTNALPINYEGNSETEEAAVFPRIARINHTCLPNCHHEWNPALQMETVHALREIARGEELSICYLLPKGRTRAERQSHLARRFGFRCGCALCTLAGREAEASDARQREIGDLEPLEACASAAELQRRVVARLQLMADEGLPKAWARPMLVSAMVQSVQDKSAAGRAASAALAGAASEAVRQSTGEDHPNYEIVSGFLSLVADFERQTQGLRGGALLSAAGGGGAGGGGAATTGRRGARPDKGGKRADVGKAKDFDAWAWWGQSFQGGGRKHT